MYGGTDFIHLDLLEWESVRSVDMILLINIFTLLTHSSYVIFKSDRNKTSIALYLKME